MSINDKIIENDKTIKANNLNLVKQIESVKLIREGYIKELDEKYDDKLLTMISEIDKIIRDAEALIGCSSKEGKNIYAKNFPSNVDKGGNIITRGLKRLGLLNKRWKG